MPLLPQAAPLPESNHRSRPKTQAGLARALGVSHQSAFALAPGSGPRAACCYRADGSCADLVFGMRAGWYDEDPLISFVGERHAHLGDAKVTLIWDDLPSHRSKKMAAYLASQRRWLVVVHLPGYAPALNPVEKPWANLKGAELANL